MAAAGDGSSMGKRFHDLMLHRGEGNRRGCGRESKLRRLGTAWLH
jgi:hypothetical protein